MASTRRLAAILAADVAGYSRLMGVDEEGTLSALKSVRSELGDPKIAEHHGRIVKTTGDGLLVEFQSVVDAVRCAVALQTAMVKRNASVAAEKRIEFRIGINLGDVIIDEGDIYGDGVNVAARLEALAAPGGICVSGTVHDHVRDRLPFVFEDLGEQRVKNIARPVHVFRIPIGKTPERAPAGPAPVPLPDKPSIAVLPFANLSGDPEQEYFADGMVEEVITALSRIRWLFVIARTSTFTYKGQAIDVKRVGHELGVRYVVEGSVRKAGNRVRVTAQLIDATSGAHLWADRFDGSFEDVFELQDKVAASVAGVIEPALQSAETDRSAHRPTADLTAYDLYLRGYAMFWSAARHMAQALQLMEQAIARDARYGPALAWAAYCCFALIHGNRSDDRETDRRKGTDFARRALEVAAEDPNVLVNAAAALAYFGEDIEAMIGLVAHALSLNPSFAHGWYVSGMLKGWAGRRDEAIDNIKTARGLNPRARMVWAHSVSSAALFFSGRFDEAVPDLLLMIQEDASYAQPFRTLAACYAHMGRLDEARAIAARLRAITPVVMPDLSYLRRTEDRQLLVSGLRLALGEAS